MPEKYVPRLSVEISEEAFNRFSNLVPWGLRSKVMAILLNDLLDLIEEHGEIVLAAILERSLGTIHVMKGIREVVRKEKPDGT